MNTSSLTLKVGTRSSRLAIIQTQAALEKITALLPFVSFQVIPMSSPGDEDRETKLEDSDPDFFTRYLDMALENGELDCAIHSAKDLPDPVPNSLEWFWLPWREDPRDVVVLRKEESIDSLPESAKIGISSERRRIYGNMRFPEASLLSVRGNIEARISQLDEGKYDLLIMAAAALLRLRLDDRISEWIPLSELQTPPGQGYLAITYRGNDDRIHRLRSLFIKPAILVGGGPGNQDYCTIAGSKALQNCDVCIHDALCPLALVEALGNEVMVIDAGKRQGKYTIPRDELDRRLVDLIRQGRKVVRLKGGDPGIYGRLAEEVAVLNKHHLPYHVIPGISSLNAATTGTGLLLTRRGKSRGFTVITPRFSGKKGAEIGAHRRTELPIVFFMAVGKLEEIVRQLLHEGRPKTEPATIIFGASTPSEKIIFGNLADITKKIEDLASDLPGLLIIGAIADSPIFNKSFGALQGKKVLVTCSGALQNQAEMEILNFGGIPIKFPLIRLVPDPNSGKILMEIKNYDWIILTSPSAVYSLFSLLKDLQIDLRTLPKILVSGPGVSRVLQEYGLNADAVPSKEFGADSMLQLAKRVIKVGHHVLRLRSQLAGRHVENTLKKEGIWVTDCILYTNNSVHYDELPVFDSIFFASSSAFKVFYNQWGASSLIKKILVAIGSPTAKTMIAYNCHPTVISNEATVRGSIKTLAAYFVNEQLSLDYS